MFTSCFLFTFSIPSRLIACSSSYKFVVAFQGIFEAQGGSQRGPQAPCTLQKSLEPLPIGGFSLKTEHFWPGAGLISHQCHCHHGHALEEEVVRLSGLWHLGTSMSPKNRVPNLFVPKQRIAVGGPSLVQTIVLPEKITSVTSI